MTVTEQVVEILRCTEDPFYLIDHYAHIQHPVRGDIPFELYPWQREELGAWLTDRHNIVLKARGIGFSWLAAAYVFWRVHYRHDPLWLFASRRGEDAEELIGKVWYVYDHLPDWMQAEVTEARATRFELAETKARILSQTANPGLGRNFHASGVLLDEFAFLPYDEEMFRSLQPTLEHGGQLIAGSTPNGVGNVFHRLYTQAEHGELDFRAMKRLYTVVPGHDEDWLRREAEDKGLTGYDIAQEHLCDFLQSGRPVFAAADVERAYMGEMYPVTKGRRHAVHVLAVDPAAMGGDFTSITVLDNDTGMEVYQEGFQKPTKEGAERVAYLEKIFPGRVVVELNGLGQAYADALPRCLKVMTTGGSKENHEGGVWKVPKHLLITSLLRELEEGELVIASKQTRDEMLVYQYRDDGKTEAPAGYHDDAIMSLALARWAYRKRLVRNVPTMAEQIDQAMRPQSMHEMYMRVFEPEKAEEMRRERRRELMNPEYAHYRRNERRRRRR